MFSPGYGTQMMLADQENSFQVRGMMNEVARSVLTSQELSTFNYYVDQYDQKTLSVDDLVTPLLHIFTTPEKVLGLVLVKQHIIICLLNLHEERNLHIRPSSSIKECVQTLLSRVHAS